MPNQEQSKWTPAEEQKLVTLKAKGLTYKQISEKMARSLYSVKKKYHALRAEGKITQDDLNDATVNLQTRTGYKWTTREIMKLREMKASGNTNDQIARSLGRTESTVKSKWYQLKLEQRQKTATGDWKPGVLADETEDRMKQAARTAAAAVRLKKSVFSFFGKN